MAFHGQGAASIAHTLIREKVPTPGWLNYSRYGKFANIYAAAPDEKRYAWTIAQVKTMLKDETYIGNAIRNKQTNISYKNKKPLGELSKAEKRNAELDEHCCPCPILHMAKRQSAGKKLARALLFDVLLQLKHEHCV